MLKRLRIENLAVIESAEFDLAEGFCVLTGETGAGKSLVVGAIDMLLGGKADPTKLRTGTNEAVIEGHFDDGDRIMKVRRKITSSGRSYAWLNDQPISTRELIQKTATLADLLGQHEHQILLNPESHINFIDIFAHLDGLADEYHENFVLLEGLNSKIYSLDREIERAEEQAKLREFELTELKMANLDLEEWSELKTSLEKFEASEKILDRASKIHGIFFENEPNIQGLLGISEKAALDIRDVVPECAQILELLETAHAASGEISRIADSIMRSMEFDPAYVEELRTRQAFLQRLCKKYGKDIQGLIEYRDGLEKKASNIEGLKEERKKIEYEIVSLRTDLAKKAIGLSLRRRKAVSELAKTLIASLIPLGMDNVRFEVLFKRVESDDGPVIIEGKKYALLPAGAESAEFLISPNPGEDLKPLASIVSGGELSRIMLVLKKVISADNSRTTLIFDEIDSGIGGDVGNAVGNMLKDLANKQQIIVVTHLPQIAQKAGAHFTIEKFDEDGRTKVRISRVEGKARQAELKRMRGESEKPISFK